MVNTYQKPSIQVKLSLIVPLILIRLAKGSKQIPRKNESNMTIFSDFRTKIWLKVISEQLKPKNLVGRQ